MLAFLWILQSIMADSPSDSPGLTDKEKEAFPGRVGGGKSNERLNKQCRDRMHKSLKSSYVRYMLNAMKEIGCEVKVGRHLVCEPCGDRLLGGFDEDRNQIVLCENNIYSDDCMTNVLTHELIHAYDHCRAHVDWKNLDHQACSEIRAANLSGECFFWKENFARLKFGWKKHQQKCVKERATQSILCVNNVTEKEARDAVEKVFDSCFKDTVPFERVPP
ncbi:PREDICTED: mitochondrial inner membrane protease ATP23 homolog isoform X4 [Amphimedon queenslandica]|uniref:Mitochondrial inner membrane protease ATP23 n=2 Tax=Amphimedon queenslandica TaxID=400682 RepID=A0AAN0INX4_AMPQE|nr:PREDICTED: mitochondrial inner membrane protease ATP23 homolog isoform X4 [Amphimedon queenslandica]|eukprot:XP_011406005.2 PREDICTED: mitochondrial inner membrane protease ATP23 homolog isoform X4 [Amphimedon queenslandica]